MNTCGQVRKDTEGHRAHGGVRNDAGGWWDVNATQKQVNGDTKGMGGHIFVCITRRENAKKHKWVQTDTGSWWHTFWSCLGVPWTRIGVLAWRECRKRHVGTQRDTVGLVPVAMHACQTGTRKIGPSNCPPKFAKQAKTTNQKRAKPKNCYYHLQTKGGMWEWGETGREHKNSCVQE